MSNDPIICEICGGKTHVIAKHLKEKHPETTYEEYKEQYPDSPLLSPLAQKKMQEQAELKRAKEAELAKAQQEKQQILQHLRKKQQCLLITTK